MLTFEEFRGINNVLKPERLDAGDLLAAVNVDIGLTGELYRRDGYTEVAATCSKNLHQADGYMLATNGAVLRAIATSGITVIHPALGPDRVHYLNLPDGRTLFSNGLIHGTTDGTAGWGWSVPAPESLGNPEPMTGTLAAGEYRYHLTYTRLVDLAEGPATSSEPVSIDQGGLFLSALPDREGFAINVYLSGKDGDAAYLVGRTVSRSLGVAAEGLPQPCETIGLQPMPVGKFLAFWKGRVLVAVDDTVWASEPWKPHLTQWRAFRQFKGRVTMIQAVDGGVFVGTERELAFMGGETYETLGYRDTRLGSVVPGSGVTVPGDKIKAGDGSGPSGDAMICIADGYLVAGWADGSTARISANQYRTSVTEVAATFRIVGGEVPQYIAIPQ